MCLSSDSNWRHKQLGGPLFQKGAFVFGENNFKTSIAGIGNQKKILVERGNQQTQEWQVCVERQTNIAAVSGKNHRLFGKVDDRGIIDHGMAVLGTRGHGLATTKINKPSEWLSDGGFHHTHRLGMRGKVGGVLVKVGDLLFFFRVCSKSDYGGQPSMGY